MITIPIDEQTIIDATIYVDKSKIGKRRSFNGNRTNQVVGMTGEFIIADLLGFERPKRKDGFDGGWDIQIGQKLIDIKTVGRTSNARLDYDSNVIEAQMHFKATHFLFCSLNKTKRLFTIVGFISKEDFKAKSKFYKKGDEFTRVNGDKMILNASGYFIKNEELIQVDSIAELKDLLIFKNQ